MCFFGKIYFFLKVSQIYILKIFMIQDFIK